MNGTYEASDIIIGVLASIGVVGLMYVFVWVYRQVFPKEE